MLSPRAPEPERPTDLGNGSGGEVAGRRVALVEFSPSGGLFQFAFHLGEALAERGHEVHLFTGPRPELAPRRGLVVHPVLPTWHPGDSAVRSAVYGKLRRGIRAARLAAAWVVLAVHLRRVRADVVLFSYWRFVLDACGVIGVRALTRPAVLGIVAHEPVPKSDARNTEVPKSGPVLDAALSAAWRRMDLVFVLGEHARRTVVDRWRPAAPVIVVPHGDSSAMAEGASIAPVPDTDPVVLFFGTWQRYKGLDVLVEAFARVRRELPAARLVLAGAPGADCDVAGLRSRSAAVGNVEFRPGYVATEDVPRLFGQARVVAVPYTRAMQSGVAHLASGFGRPVVGTSVGDIPAVVAHGRTGLLVPPGDDETLADALLQLLRQPELATALGEAGRRRVAEGSSWATVAEQVEAGFGSTGQVRDGHGVTAPRDGDSGPARESR
ncbi:glycosyltransferase family 4 protein [Pseudonocardia charpentierae]|uniref:Glycosyltransferase family 4 protein n=1 Tax=Pseudonocardia charpentierae TaxID=3075545 RepID=A0ABU2NHR7_9PSEU|nr:glycosyltransferase family 4 protein [Pseudonocardia sp. DSM 45834]MDT0353507.1 glycosyltransferase family 4 protein [Pseudonocardia sp. DSM 45834]